MPCDLGSISVSPAPVCIDAAKQGHLLAKEAAAIDGVFDDVDAVAAVDAAVAASDAAAIAAADAVDAAVRISSLMASLIVFIVAIAFVEWQM